MEGKGAGDVRGIAGDLAPGVQHHDLAVAEGGIVGRVVQDTGVGPRAGYGGVGLVFGVAGDADESVFRFDLGFVGEAVEVGEDGVVSGSGDCICLADEGDFVGIFEGAGGV